MSKQSKGAVMKVSKRNFVAKAVRTPAFRMRVVKNVKVYDRKRDKCRAW